MEQIWLNKIIYTFSQEGNTNGTTADYEELIVEVECPIGSIVEKGGYLVLRTSTGWSINDSEELMELLKLVEKGVSSEIKE